MVVPPVIDQDEIVSKDIGKAGRVMLNDRQAAASLRTVRCECSNDDMSTWLYAALEPTDVSSLIAFVRQKMECRAIMPQIVCLGWLPFRDVCDDPSDIGASIAKTSAGHIKCCS